MFASMTIGPLKIRQLSKKNFEWLFIKDSAKPYFPNLSKGLKE